MLPALAHANPCAPGFTLACVEGCHAEKKDTKRGKGREWVVLDFIAGNAEGIKATHVDQNKHNSRSLANAPHLLGEVSFVAKNTT